MLARSTAAGTTPIRRTQGQAAPISTRRLISTRAIHLDPNGKHHIGAAVLRMSPASSIIAANRALKMGQRIHMVDIVDINAAGVPLDVALGAIAASAAVPQVANLIKNALRPRRCNTCLGPGHNACECCKGRGKLGGPFEGKAMVACPECSGKGRTLCPACDATGLRNAWLWKPSEDPGWGPRGEP